MVIAGAEIQLRALCFRPNHQRRFVQGTQGHLSVLPPLDRWYPIRREPHSCEAEYLSADSGACSNIGDCVSFRIHEGCTKDCRSGV